MNKRVENSLKPTNVLDYPTPTPWDLCEAFLISIQWLVIEILKDKLTVKYDF